MDDRPRPRGPRRKSRRPVTIFAVSMVCISLWLWIGCSGTEVGNPGMIASADFTSDQELETYLKSEYSKSVFPEAAYTETEAPPPTSDDPASPAGPDFGDQTGSAFPEFHVRHANDTSKATTDGNYLYVARSASVAVVQIGAQPAMAAEIPVPGEPAALHLFNGILAVLYTPEDGRGNAWTGGRVPGEAPVGIPRWVPVNARTAVEFVDVRKPSRPRRLKRIDADGHLITAKVNEGRLWIVLQFLPELPDLTLAYTGNEGNRNAAVDGTRNILQPVDLSTLSPGVRVFGHEGETLQTGRLIPLSNFQKPELAAGGTIVTTLAVDLTTDALPVTAHGIVGDGHAVLLAENALFITRFDWNREQPGAEPAGKTTVFQRFALDGADIRPGGRISLPGHPPDRKSLAVVNRTFHAALRVETPSSTANSQEIEVLTLGGDGFGVIDSTVPDTRGQYPAAARFTPDFGYLPAFGAQSDIHRVATNNPADLQPVDALYPVYPTARFHTFGDNRLIALGREASGDNTQSGVMISLYTETPAAGAIDSVRIENDAADSPAFADPGALAVFPGANLFALPVQGANGAVSVIFYRATPGESLEHLGRIEVDSPAIQGQAPFRIRTLLIGGRIYVVTPAGVATAAPEDISTGAAWVSFSGVNA